jgi:hypothetical protein
VTGAPGGAGTPPASPCVPCTTGSLEVTAYWLKVCWDTGPEGEETPDPPFENVEVSISGPASRTDRTGADGKVLFTGLPPGRYTISAKRIDRDEHNAIVAEFEDITPTADPGADQPVDVHIGSTSFGRRKLWRKGLECNRKHTAMPGPAGDGGPTIWMPIFWLPWSEPFFLAGVRDTVCWLGSLVILIVGFAVSNLSLAALASAFHAYFWHVIFGMGPGIAMMVAAFAFFVVLIVLGAVPSLLPFPAIDPVTFPVVAGVWAGFTIALMIGRTERFSNKDWGVPIACGVVGAVTAALVLFVLSPPGFGVWAVIGIVALTLVLSLVSGLLGHAFMNDGRTNATVWGPSDFLLPYEGDRYCVQGLRGWISHFDWQEYSYDWSIPEGVPFLCTKEGHIVGYREDKTGTKAFSGNDTANEIRVRHRDGTVAMYLHLLQNGVTGASPELGPVKDELVANPVHVHVGQRLALNGNVGISMFPHLHYTVAAAQGAPTNPGEASTYVPVKFQDGDVASHAGQCYSMRKYRSSNVDRGPIHVPPPAPGAPKPTASTWQANVYNVGGFTAPEPTLTPAPNEPLPAPQPINPTPAHAPPEPAPADMFVV